MGLFDKVIQGASGAVNSAGHVVDNVAKDLNPFKGPRGDITYKGKLYLKKASVLNVTNVGASLVDNAFELLQQKVEIKLISSTAIEPSLGTGKVSKAGDFQIWGTGFALFAQDHVEYNIEFHVNEEFGIPGAFTVRNNHINEFYLLRLTVQIPGSKLIEFPCNSWVYPAFAYKVDRVFFSNELCLPGDTPPGLSASRKSDLKALQGDGTGTRVASDRIYDYDVYNDLGSARPVLGGTSTYPYPRRCRTGRKVVNGAEERTLLPVIQSFYLPADEVFPANKNSDFLGGTLKAVVQGFIPGVVAKFPLAESFVSFNEVDLIYDKGFDISKVATVPLQSLGIFGAESPLKLLNQVVGTPDNSSLLKFPMPQVVQANRKAWMSDEEFGRQMLCGANPLVIEGLKVFPPTSTLPNATTAFAKDQIVHYLDGKSVEQALQENKLFILNYYDSYFPFLERINAQPNTFTYASRTILYLKSDGTLKPIAIELSLPSSQRVFTPPTSGVTDWVWELAKAHAASVDSGYHQVVSHWLRTHCCIEPFIIATQRQLSVLHPLNPFLRPHFKHTMSINAQARQILINSDGIVEYCFNPGRYSLEMTSAVYKSWNLFEQGLPADLIKRGVAVADPSAKHGLKLLIEDYPYATDGLEIWSALVKWTEAYVSIVYKDDQTLATDPELQAWWHEIIHFGHADKKSETWWGNLDTRKKLAETLTTIIWVASAHHAAVNFGQYAYLGYMPNHPTRTHRAIPELSDPEYQKLVKDGERWYLSAVSRKAEAIKMMLTLEVLSTHAEDEEYLGTRSIDNWTANDKAVDAFRKFSQDMKSVDSIITGRNNDPKLKNRRGPVQVPYSFLYSSSERGLTGRGVPNSISI